MFPGPWGTNSLINEQHREASKGEDQGQLCKQAPWKIWEVSNISFCFPHIAVIDGLSAKPCCLTQSWLLLLAAHKQELARA